MGLKYIETIKSIMLLLLIALSITFTFSIWTYSPNLETIEETSAIDTSIGKKKTIAEIVKPYKTVFNFGDDLRGTTNSNEIDTIVDEIQSWNITDITIVDDNFSAEEFGELSRKPNRFTLYFHGEVPLTVYDSVLYFDDQVSVPELSFNRIVVDWNPETVLMDIYFISKTNKTLYSAKARTEDYREFQRSVLKWGGNLLYMERSIRVGFPYIVVPVEPLKAITHTYFQEEINPSEFRDALFSDPNAVRRSHASSYQEEYGDDHARMKVFTDKKKLDFVYPLTKTMSLQSHPSCWRKQSIM